MCFLAAFLMGIAPTTPAGTPAASISITDVNGVPVSSTQTSSIGGGFDSVPETVYHDNLPQDSTLEHQLVVRGLRTPSVLREWDLCSTVLSATAYVSVAQANAMITDPNDAPFDFGKSLDVKTQIAYPGTTRSLVASDLAWGAVLRQAALLASKAHIQCATHMPAYEAHWATLSGRDRYGLRRLSIPDYVVLGSALVPVEFMQFNGDCVSSLKKDLSADRASKLDARIQEGPWFDTYDAWSKADNIAYGNAEISIAKRVGIACAVSPHSVLAQVLLTSSK